MINSYFISLISKNFCLKLFFLFLLIYFSNKNGVAKEIERKNFTLSYTVSGSTCSNNVSPSTIQLGNLVPTKNHELLEYASFSLHIECSSERDFYVSALIPSTTIELGSDNTLVKYGTKSSFGIVRNGGGGNLIRFGSMYSSFGENNVCGGKLIEDLSTGNYKEICNYLPYVKIASDELIGEITPLIISFQVNYL